jgi:hypothetical protein
VGVRVGAGVGLGLAVVPAADVGLTVIAAVIVGPAGSDGVGSGDVGSRRTAYPTPTAIGRISTASSRRRCHHFRVIGAGGGLTSDHVSPASGWGPAGRRGLSPGPSGGSAR